MRTNEEKIEALHKRAAQLEKEKLRRRTRILQAASVTVCIAVIAALGFFMPDISNKIVANIDPNAMRASIFTSSAALGYIIIGITAFILGAAVTILCFYLQKWQKERDDDREDKP